MLAEAAEPDRDLSARISHDASRVVVTRMDVETGLVDLWLIDPVRKLKSRLTFDDGIDTSPVWSPDDNRIVFASSPQGTLDLYIQKLDGSTSPSPLFRSGNPLRPSDWSRDGAWIVYEEEHPQTRRDLWIIPASGQASPKALLRTPFNEYQGQLSPDGKRLAYTSDDSGRPEIFIRDLEPGRTPYRVSPNGGSQPHWKDDGSELYYDSAAGKLMAVSISVAAGGQVSSGTPTPLFDLPSPGPGVPDFRYDVGSHGQKFIAVVPEDNRQEALTVVVNWHRNLR